MYGEEYDDRDGGAFEEEHISDCAVWCGGECDGKLCETAYAYDAGDDAYNWENDGCE